MHLYSATYPSFLKALGAFKIDMSMCPLDFITSYISFKQNKHGTREFLVSF